MLLTWGGTPNNESAAAMPANSATVVPRFAMSTTATASAVQRTPKRSRMTPDSPWPVAMPSRAPTSWVNPSAIIVTNNAHIRP